MAASPSLRLYRLALTYELAPDGAFERADGPAETVPVHGEGRLYRRLAKLAAADDAALLAAACRYGPLGPVTRVQVADQPAYLWALDQSVRRSLRQVKLLRAWIAFGGTTPIPGHVAPVAHALATVAEADDGTLQRLADLASGDARFEPGEQDTLDARLDRMEHAWLAALSRRAGLINAHLAKGDHSVRVDVKPKARAKLASAARNWQFFVEKAVEAGGMAVAIPPGTLGRMATQFRPYFGQSDLPLIEPETARTWRTACGELAIWVGLLDAPSFAEDRPALTALLVLRLQQLDAWPFPTDELLGTFPRALWSLWADVAQRPPDRRCSYAGCTRMLPPSSHGNRRLCANHRREQDRLRAARNRRRMAAPSPLGRSPSRGDDEKHIYRSGAQVP